MQDGRFSTIRFNEWICITAQHEKAVARLGRQVYQAYSKGLVTDYPSIELCKEISETFAEARSVRLELEEELERDALDGLNVQEARKAAEVLKLTQAQKARRDLKVRFAKLAGKAAINRNLAAHRDRVRELSRDLGLRALARYNEEPVVKVKGHKALCRLAERLQEDADKKWEEIVISNKETGGGFSFHTTLIGFVTNFASFSKNTYWGKMLLKLFKYNEEEEQKKLAQQYEGSSSAEALKAQMAEIDEPDLDIGREIDSMQQEYLGPPEEWDISPTESWGAVETEAASSSEPDPTPDFDMESQDWSAGSETWDTEAEDDFLAAASSIAETPAPPAPPVQPSPTVFRKKPEPEAGSWLGGGSASPMPSGIGIDRSPEPAEPEDDWGWGTFDESADEGAASTPAARSSGSPLGGSRWEEVGDSDPFQEALDSERVSTSWSSSPPAEEPPPPATEPFLASKPSGKRPPFAKPSAGPGSRPEVTDPTLETMQVNLSGTEIEHLLKASRSEPTVEKDEAESAPGDDSDPLLRLLRDEEKPPDPQPVVGDEMELGDDLLPAFLRERSDDEEEPADDTFIPQLPSFLESEEGPKLEILPFGSTGEDESGDDDEPFIPAMPD